MIARTGRRPLRRAVVVAVALVISGCSASESSPVDSGSSVASGPLPAATLTQSGSAQPKPTQSTPETPTVTSTSTARSTSIATPTATAAVPPVPPVSAAQAGAAVPSAKRLPALDRLAGLRTTKVAWSGTGKLRVVPGKTAAPGKGRIYRIKVEVEAGLAIDRTAFATYVLATLNDKRGWTERGRRRFARTDGVADLRVVLASPETSAAICRPLRTGGKLSCRNGDAAVLTLYRWTKATPEYKGNHDGYRRYVINHEVGHGLGHGHEYCAGRGRIAPVMMQQTKGLKGCKPNPWPHP